MMVLRKEDMRGDYTGQCIVDEIDKEANKDREFIRAMIAEVESLINYREDSPEKSTIDVFLWRLKKEQWLER